MLNLENIDVRRQFASEKEEAEYIRRYIFQLYIELDYRLGELDRRIKEIENDNTPS